MADSEDVKKKYAEIAALKKAIEEQKRGASVLPYPSGQLFGGRGRGRGGYRGGYRAARPTTYRNMTYVLNGDGNGDGRAESSSYVSRVSKGGMSLVNSTIYHQDQQKYQALQQAQLAVQNTLKEQRRLVNLRSRVAKYRSKTDGCDRVEVDGDKFAVTRLGNRLVPITVPEGDKSRSATWDGRTYTRKHNGVLKCFGGRKKRYVPCGRLQEDQHHTNIRIPVDQCRYFTRTGE
ncbi:uncharacterized protein CANTADRAFT_284994 [Suhomyces tanzawaensis NRRL Y-17324]|uniref:Uncharacterized protein n=1 Tax=Suhomyces tanzawaensis NRRL Y-17324 TaxID=984487 RepID=A0A1E4SEF7_9ASCO|nr:uncharacterized protein CANTADRAFT_284994 [Suhomyces tanzawaensis NRRL Y-17324]ODV77895.1 hypothetical protein CANTADRAFT_284994 [Suhomyces tanzawaensis NRRL Y-17324]